MAKIKYVFFLLSASCYVLPGLGQPSIISKHTKGFNGIPKYDRFELGLKLPVEIQQKINNFIENGNGLNPYDPEQVEVVASYTCQNSNRVFNRNGFYYREFSVVNNDWLPLGSDFTYRIRLSPPDAGNYAGKISLAIEHAIVSSVGFTFSVANSDNPGHLIVANENLRKLQYENGDIFFGIGQDIGYVIDAGGGGTERPERCLQWYCRPPAAYEQYRSFISALGDHNGNFVRLRLDPFDFPIEWPEWKMYSTDPEPKQTLLECINNYDHNQRFMWEFDKVMGVCEEKGIYVLLNILLDQSWSIKITPGEAEDFNWKRNPYAALLGTDLPGLKKFFSDPAAKKHYKNLLYYISARWGYSTNLGIWELINETQNLEDYDNNKEYAQSVENWVCEMKSFLETKYPWHPVTNGSIGPGKSGDQNPCLDIWNKNSYNISITDCKYDNGNYNERANSQFEFNKAHMPFFWGELGVHVDVDENTDREFHNALWATTMMGGISTGLYWWDYRQKNNINHRQNFRILNEFCKKIDWKEPFISGKDFSEGDITCRSKKEKKKIFSFWQRNEAKNFAFGWAMNASSTWYSDPSEFADQDGFTAVSNELSCIPSANPYDIPSNACHPQIHIKDLLGTTKYDIEIYDTYNASNKLLENFSEMSDLTGNLKFRRQFTFKPVDPFYPDYAFIVRTHDSDRGRISIFPNPANDLVNFQLYDSNIQEFTVKIYNELGQLVLVQSNKKTINVSELAEGFYVFQVLYANTNKTAKLIIRH